jgi:ribonuclease HII
LDESVSANESEKARIAQLLEYERALWQRKIQYVAGVDEAGRGPLAGPVVAAAVIFPADIFIPGINDSKKIAPQKRLALLPVIQKKAIAFATAAICEKTIDQINILQASFEAMRLALEQLSVSPQHVLVDGRPLPGIPCRQTSLIKGDQKSFSIAAASILAKVTRDQMMETYDHIYPQYGFVKHKGYCTQEHVEALRKYGLSPIHRRSFRVKGLTLE